MTFVGKRLVFKELIVDVFVSLGFGKFSHVVFILIAPSELISTSEEEPKKPMKLYSEVNLNSKFYFPVSFPSVWSRLLFV